jgi:exodeoxyribonuclease-5
MPHDTAPIMLTPHQQAAIDWLVRRLFDGLPLLALRGLAGTGKTSIIPALQDALKLARLGSILAAPTHRAVMILRKKGLEAETVHSAALVPYFTADYRRACAWLGEELPTRPDEGEAEARADVDGLPWLVYEAVKPDLERGRALKRSRRYKARRRLASVGISGKVHFAGFGPKAGHGILIIDEASMVGEAMLALCQAAYAQIVLVGDPGQLPPVKDTAVLSQVPGIELTEIHRQAADSPIVQLAYQARAGDIFWPTLDHDPLHVGAPVRAIDEVSARRFLTCPLLVWRNEVRTANTQAIRKALGYSRERLEVGEPLMCRSTDQEDRVLGFFNNGLYTVTETDPTDPRLVTVKDPLGETQEVRVHLEELDGDDVDPRSIPFRFGYCLTVHTAQGGEWPRVYISLPELRALTGARQRDGRLEELAQWTYTAITRAKTTLRFLTQHCFTPPQERTTMPPKPTDPIRPPSAPLVPQTPSPSPESAAPQTPQTPQTPAADPLRAETPEEIAIFGEDNIFDHAVPDKKQQPHAGEPVRQYRPGSDPDDIPDLDPAPPLSAEEEALFGADDISDPAVPLTLTETLREATVHPPGDTQAPDAPPETSAPSVPSPGAREELPARFGEHEALLQAFAQHVLKHVDTALVETTREAGKTVHAMYDYVESLITTDKERLRHMETLLDQLVAKVVAEGILVRRDPYQLTVQAVSPHGYPVTMQIAQGSPEDLLEELGNVTDWLTANDYKPA